MHTRARHTHTTHNDTTGPERGDCMLVDGGSERDPSGTCRGPPNCRKPALERLARHSPFDRYMKAQLQLAGGRRKPGRHGFSSDTPRGRLALPYICATCATCEDGFCPDCRLYPCADHGGCSGRGIPCQLVPSRTLVRASSAYFISTSKNSPRCRSSKSD